MTRSRQIAITATGVVVAIAVFVAIARSRPSSESRVATNVASHTEVAAGDVVDSVAEFDSSAITALDRMAAYLRTLKSFQLKANVITEDVRTDGQKVQIERNVDLVARRPDRLYAEIKNDRQQRLFFYDGRNFTLFAPRSNFYATVDAPPSIEKLADALEDKFALELPLVDLFRWGTPEADERVITSAVDLGPSAINGVTCEQYGFRQEGIDWQLWIQLGDAPLPCRIVITTLTDVARPQNTTTYSWNLAPSFSDATFAFQAPSDAKRIPFAQVQVASSPSSSDRK
jgi:hypothetical protein